MKKNKIKKYIITTEAKDHLGQAVRYMKVVDEPYLQTAIANAELEGYTVVSVAEWT